MGIRDMLGKKKFLVIDDQAEMRLVVKSIVVQLGVTKVIQASSGEEGLEKMEQEHFDYIICDYNIPGGRSGQQFLEELIHRKLLKSTMVFAMVTGENARDMVMAALEHAPDIYLSKPIRAQDLMERIKKVEAKKLALQAVGAALDSEDNALALEEAKKVVDSDSPFRSECFRIMADINLSEEKYKDVEGIVSKLLGAREIPWARLALGKAQFYQGDYMGAEENFRKLFEENEAYVAAGDWLARALCEQGHQRDAQAVVEKTAESSPRGILRQQLLGKLAKENGDIEVATKAFKTATGLGKHSIHRCSDDYVNYTNSFVDLMKKRKGLAGSRMYKEALYVIDNMLEDFKDVPVDKIRAHLQRRHITTQMDRPNEAKLSQESAIKVYEAVKKTLTPFEEALIAKYFHEYDVSYYAVEIASGLIERVRDNEEVIEVLRPFYDVDKMLSVDMTELRKEYNERALISNNEGLRLFKEGKFKEATDHFLTAYHTYEQAQKEVGMELNLNSCLNGIHAMLNCIRSGTSASHYIERCEKLLSECSELQRQDERFSHYEQLKRDFEKLKAKE